MAKTAASSSGGRVANTAWNQAGGANLSRYSPSAYSGTSSSSNRSSQASSNSSQRSSSSSSGGVSSSSPSQRTGSNVNYGSDYNPSAVPFEQVQRHYDWANRMNREDVQLGQQTKREDLEMWKEYYSHKGKVDKEVAMAGNPPSLGGGGGGDAYRTQRMSPVSPDFKNPFEKSDFDKELDLRRKIANQQYLGKVGENTSSYLSNKARAEADIEGARIQADATRHAAEMDYRIKLATLEAQREESHRNDRQNRWNTLYQIAMQAPDYRYW